MSGHNRWSKIKHKKEASDSKKSKLWTKVIKEITVSARLGGGDINGNPRLRTAIDKARAVNMTNDVIERSIKKGVGDLDGVTYEEFAYEVYGPGGTAMIVVSSDMEEMVQICDRVLAFSRGRIVAELSRGEITVEALTRAVGGIAEAPQPPRGRAA